MNLLKTLLYNTYNTTKEIFLSNFLKKNLEYCFRSICTSYVNFKNMFWLYSHKKMYHGTLTMYHGTLTMYHGCFSCFISILIDIHIFYFRCNMWLVSDKISRKLNFRKLQFTLRSSDTEFYVTYYILFITCHLSFQNSLCLNELLIGMWKWIPCTLCSSAYCGFFITPKELTWD